MNTLVYYIIAGGFLVCTLALFILGVLLAVQKNPMCILPLLFSSFIFTALFVPVSVMDAFDKIMECVLALVVLGILCLVFLSPIVLFVLFFVSLVSSII